MSALGPLLLSRGLFLRSHWAGFSQLRKVLVLHCFWVRRKANLSETDPHPGTWLRSDRLAPLVMALGPSPRLWSRNDNYKRCALASC